MASNTTSYMVPVYKLLRANNIVVCAACASDAHDDYLPVDEQFKFSRRQAGWVCPICEKPVY
jgi:hypothetical protein